MVYHFLHDNPIRQICNQHDQVAKQDNFHQVVIQQVERLDLPTARVFLIRAKLDHILDRLKRQLSIEYKFTITVNLYDYGR
ncbi:unnamed protein product [Schistosoma curassoni]|uniref:Transposase n=1 Tax=Schistosoma curassoni TaxID=6186 RepID=A0A183KMB9_9TREM|nr:unnamed protein product [Schistosoma curassoni]